MTALVSAWVSTAAVTAMTGVLHAGFYVSYNNSMLEPNITAAVRKMHAEHPNAPLYAIGHSMGAALATICAMDVKFKVGLRDVRLYTFGSPRVGNLEFANFVYSQTTVRRPLLTASYNPASLGESVRSSRCPYIHHASALQL